MLTKVQRVLLSAAIAAGVTFLTAFLVLLTALPEGASVTDIGSIPFVVALIGAVAQFAKDMQTYLAQPPE